MVFNSVGVQFGLNRFLAGSVLDIAEQGCGVSP